MCPDSPDRPLSALDLRLTDPDFWIELDTMNRLDCATKPTRSPSCKPSGEFWLLCMDS
jgi:hypothetical protein